MPAPVKLSMPFLTLDTVDFTCFCSGIHLLPEEDDTFATFCDPKGARWTLTLDLKMSIGTGSVDEALWGLGGPGAVVPFDFAYQNTAGPGTADNPHWTGEVTIPSWTPVDAGINEPTDITLEMELIEPPVRSPTVPPTP
jgi:hypothetical protein